MRTKLWMVAGAAALWACGGATFAGTGDGGAGADGGGSSSGGSGGSSGSSGSSGGSSSSSGGGSGSSSGGSGGSSSGGGSGSSSGGCCLEECPQTPPTGGTSCPKVGLQCEYGDNPNPDCNDIESCTPTGWSYPTPGPACPAGTCPATYADVAQGQDCSPQGLDCSYTQGQCNCDVEPESAKQTPVWLCTTPASGCPEPRPDIGTSCTQPNLSCDYGGCTGGIDLECTGGIWQEEATACPQVGQ
jgi:hypothetical protein